MKASTFTGVIKLSFHSTRPSASSFSGSLSLSLSISLTFMSDPSSSSSSSSHSPAKVLPGVSKSLPSPGLLSLSSFSTINPSKDLSSSSCSNMFTTRVWNALLIFSYIYTCSLLGDVIYNQPIKTMSPPKKSPRNYILVERCNYRDPGSSADWLICNHTHYLNN